MDASVIPWVGLLWLGAATSLHVVPQPQRDLIAPAWPTITGVLAFSGVLLTTLQWGFIPGLVSGVAAVVVAAALLLAAGGVLSRHTWQLTWVPLATFPYALWIDLAVGWVMASIMAAIILTRRGRAHLIHASASAGLESVGIDLARKTVRKPQPLDPGALPTSGARWPVAPTLFACVAVGLIARTLLS